MKLLHEASQNSPPPPPGPAPPRPVGLQRDMADRHQRLGVRFEKMGMRSHSCDVVPDGRGSRADGAFEEDASRHGGGAGHNILVAVRCRRLLPQETMAGGRSVITITDGQTVVLEDPQTTAADDYLRINKSKERRYHFDEAFDEQAPTRQVYERTTRPLISGVLQGFNATVFAYGATSAGKTHTMLGNPSMPGVMMMTLEDLFEEVASQRSERQFEVKCSFLEVYNENVRDLLRPDADYLDIREDPIKGMCVAGISEVGGLESASEIMALLHQANRYRTTEATGANVTSSRSHAVLQVVVEQRDRTADMVVNVNLGKLSMIDLAGSERASQTNNKGLRMIEGANINRSLLALGNCITALSSGVAFVPYRDSKMTRLLKDSLGGNCRTAMIANVSPCHLNYEDTHNTLKYANRAKNIKTKAVRNVMRVNYHVSKYTEIIKELRGEIADLKAKLASAPESVAAGGGIFGLLESDLHSVAPKLREAEDKEADAHAQSVNWKQDLLQNFEERVRIKRRLIDLAHQMKNQMMQKSQAQVGISQWESARQQSRGDGEAQLDTPRPIRDLQEKLLILKKELARSEELTKDLESLLAENQQKAERLHAELPRRVQNKDMRAFLGLVSRIYVMEVENMDLQEMHDVTGPLIEQKDLEAEALRLQIQMRDRLIKEQDQLLKIEHQASLPKPSEWLDLESLRLSKPSRRVQEDSVSPVKFAPSGRKYLAEGGAGILSPSMPDLGRSQDKSESGVTLVLPPLSPTARGRFAVRAAPERGSGRSHNGESHSAADTESAEAGPAPPLDISGRGLGVPASSSAMQQALVPPSPPPMAKSTWEVDADSSRLPTVEGHPVLLLPLDRRPPLAPWSLLEQIYGPAGGPASPMDGRPRKQGETAPRRSRKKLRRKSGSTAWSLREKAEGRPKEKEGESSQSQGEGNDRGSGSERVLTPPRTSARGDGPSVVGQKDPAVERKGIIEKLNRKMKSGYAPA